MLSSPIRYANYQARTENSMEEKKERKGEKKKEEEVEEINTRPFYNCFPGIERV